MANKTKFHIPKMDCASEEQMIRMKLDGDPNIKHLDFDIPNRTLFVVHDNSPSDIEHQIADLDLGSKLVESVNDYNAQIIENTQSQSRLLWTVLLINFGFFLVEMTTGFFSRSMGLVADSLDMLADALVYGLSLLAVGGTVARKKNIAKASGYFQLALAIIGFVEVIRRFLGYDSPPVFSTMIIVSILALIANSICLWLLQKSKSDEAHMKASAIFTSNDVIINIGVIVAGGLVYITESNKPDLVVGSLVFVVVLRGAMRILRLSK